MCFIEKVIAITLVSLCLFVIVSAFYGAHLNHVEVMRCLDLGLEGCIS